MAFAWPKCQGNSSSGNSCDSGGSKWPGCEPLMLWEICCETMVPSQGYNTTIFPLWWKGGDVEKHTEVIEGCDTPQDPGMPDWKGFSMFFLWAGDGIETINPTRSGGVWILRVMIKFQMWIWERCYYPPVLVQRLQEANYTIIAFFFRILTSSQHVLRITYHKCKKGD